jgi:hypothetical protein
MTQKERISQLEADLMDLRKTVLALSVELATRPYSQQIITTIDPLPVHRLLPYSQPMPWVAPFTCQADTSGVSAGRPFGI